MIEIIHIESPYITVGKKFHWPYKAIGIGISIAKMRGDGILHMTIGKSKKIWTIEKSKARDFVNQYKSVHEARGTRLGVLPWAILKEEKYEAASLDL